MQTSKQKTKKLDFLDDPVFKTLPAKIRDMGLIPSPDSICPRAPKPTCATITETVF